MADVKLPNKKALAGLSGGVMAFTTAVFAYIDSKTDAIDKRLDDKYTATREYVDVRHSEVQSKLENIEKILFRIDDRVYLIKRKLKE